MLSKHPRITHFRISRQKQYEKLTLVKCYVCDRKHLGNVFLR